MYIITSIYSLVTTIMAPMIAHHLKKRIATGKEHPERYTEKMGIASQSPPANKTVLWVHAVSLGESLSALPLVKDIIALDYAIVMTTSTVTSADMIEKYSMENRLQNRLIHQYAPIDCPQWVQAFIAHWQPQKALFLESEIWANMLSVLKQKAIPIYSVNTRIGQKSMRWWKRFPSLGRYIFSHFTALYPQNTSTADFLHQLCGTSVCIKNMGNLKYIPNPQTDIHLDLHLGDRPVWLVASTHPEDEAFLYEALSPIYVHIPNLLTIIVPRHPHRLDDVQRTFASYTQSVRSKQDPITPKTQIYIADTIGELQAFYDVVPLCMVGGSFGGGYGGHNPLEPARAKTAIIQGRDTANFGDITDTLNAYNAHVQVATPKDLARTVCDMMSHPSAMHDMGIRAQSSLQHHADTVTKLIQSMEL